jgi:hypothetical protein
VKYTKKSAPEINVLHDWDYSNVGAVVGVTLVGVGRVVGVLRALSKQKKLMQFYIGDVMKIGNIACYQFHVHFYGSCCY